VLGPLQKAIDMTNQQREIQKIYDEALLVRAYIAKQ